MSNSSVRTVVLFSIIALVLVGAAVGGVRLIKARNNSYATSQQKVAQADTKQQSAPQQQPQKDSTKSSQTQTKQNSSSSQTTTPPANNTTTQTPSASNKSVASTPAPAPAQHNDLPATSSFSPSEAMPTLTLVALAIFFGSKLMRARADYRRYISS